MFSQTDMVLAYLKKGHSITTLEAINMFGITRLSAVIYSLKEEGHEFLTKDVKKQNRFGKECIVAEYTLKIKRNIPISLF